MDAPLDTSAAGGPVSARTLAGPAAKAPEPTGPEGLSALIRPLVSPRRHGWYPIAVFAIALAFEAVFLTALGAVKQTSHILGLPGSLMALTALVAGALAGPLLGAATALAGGIVYYGTVASMGSRGTSLATAVSIILWMFVGLLAGSIADALRDQATHTRRTALRLGEAHARQEAQAEAARLYESLELSLLPALPLTHPGLRIVTAYRPSEARLQLGGDFFDVLTLSDGRLAVIVGDVAGHGPQAAALGARLRAGWRALTLSGASLDTTVASLDAMVAEDDASGEVFATACLAWIDPATSEAELVCVGHAPPVFVHDGAAATITVPAGMPLGPFGVTDAQSVRVELPEDWLLFFYTDGLVEGRAAPGSRERYGVERIIDRLVHDPGLLADEASLDQLVADVEVANGEPLGDDVAVVAVRSVGGDLSSSQSPG